MDAVLQGAVRAKALLLAQDDAALSAIKAAVAQEMKRLFRNDGCCRVSHAGPSWEVT
jgi:hypothetical protein